jgi:hypothetical protein
MSYRISGIDVHKKMLAVVVSDVEVDGEFRFERRMFGSNPEQLRSLACPSAKSRAHLKSITYEKVVSHVTWMTLRPRGVLARDKAKKRPRISGVLFEIGPEHSFCALGLAVHL